MVAKKNTCGTESLKGQKSTYESHLESPLSLDDNCFALKYGAAEIAETDQGYLRACERLSIAIDAAFGAGAVDDSTWQSSVTSVKSALQAIAAEVNRIQNEYIAQFNGNAEAILRDIEAAISAAALQDGYKEYLHGLKSRAATMRANLDEFSGVMHPELVKEAKAKLRIVTERSKRGFTSYREYIAEVASLQLYALDFYGLPRDAAEDLLNDLASKRYAPPKNKPLPAVQQPIGHIIPNYVEVPNSRIANMVMEVVSSDGLFGLDRFKLRKERSNRASVAINPVIEGYPARINPQARAITLKTVDNKTQATALITVTINEIESIQGRNNSLAPVIAFVLTQVAKQAISRGALLKTEISFSLREMVEIGMFSNNDSARKAVKAAIKCLTQMQVSAEESTPRKTERFAIATLFTFGEVKNSVVTLAINDHVSWSMIASHYMHLPQYYFRMRNKKHQKLVYYIHNMMRTNAHKIAERGYLSIGLSTIQSILELPHEDGCPNPQRDIKEQIHTAFYAIEDEHKKDFDGDPLEVIFTVGDEKPVADWLNGEVRITPNSALMGSLESVGAARQKRIAAHKNKP